MTSIRLDYNKVYHFRYKAVGEGILHVYDKTPLIFILDVTPKMILGLNMHWVHRKDRVELYENIMEIMDKTKTVNKKLERSRLTYKMLQKPKFRTGLIGIRKYYLTGITRLQSKTPEQMAVVLGKYGKYFEYRMRKVYKRTGYKD